MIKQGSRNQKVVIYFISCIFKLVFDMLNSFSYLFYLILPV